MKRIPRGFAADHPRSEWLRVKGVELPTRAGTPKWLATSAAPAKTLELLHRGRPVNQWLDTHVGPSTYRRSIDGANGISPELAPVIRDSAPAGLAAAETSNHPLTVIDAVRTSVVEGFSQSMLLAGRRLTIGTLYVALRTPPRTQEHAT